jgi:hypothetical protein
MTSIPIPHLRRQVAVSPFCGDIMRKTWLDLEDKSNRDVISLTNLISFLVSKRDTKENTALQLLIMSGWKFSHEDFEGY